MYKVIKIVDFSFENMDRQMNHKQCSFLFKENMVDSIAVSLWRTYTTTHDRKMLCYMSIGLAVHVYASTYRCDPIHMLNIENWTKILLIDVSNNIMFTLNNTAQLGLASSRKDKLKLLWLKSRRPKGDRIWHVWKSSVMINNGMV